MAIATILLHALTVSAWAITITNGELEFGGLRSRARPKRDLARSQSHADEDDAFVEFSFDDPIDFCVSLLGNGYKFSSYAAAFARISEDIGSINCATGGSAASAMSFFLESIAINPSTRRCDKGRLCTGIEKRRREALLWKSFQSIPILDGIYSTYKLGPKASKTSEVELTNFIDSFENFLLVATDVMKSKEIDIENLSWLFSDFFVLRAFKGFSSAASNANLIHLVNLLNMKEILSLLATSPNPLYHIDGIIYGAKTFVGLKPTVWGQDLFFILGILDFDKMALVLGKAASFYAGYGSRYDHRGMERWLDACSNPTVGLTWDETSKFRSYDHRFSLSSETCGDKFRSLYDNYMQKFDDRRDLNRATEEIGKYRPVLVATSLVVGDGADDWRSANEKYRDASTFDFSPSYDDFRIGYFGQEEHLTKTHEHLQEFYADRFRTQRFHPLVGYTWQEVISTSTAEPTLSSGTPLNENDGIGLGGWPDPLRINVAYGLGAERVVSIVARNDDHSYPRSVFALLGAPDSLLDDLYSFDVESEVVKEISEATGVWCTNWGGFSSGDQGGLFEDSYYAPFITVDPLLSQASNAVPKASIRSCSPTLGLQ